MTDVFKKVYTEMPKDIKETIFSMKEKAEELQVYFDRINNREMSIAKTNLEQAMMWATKAHVIEGDKLNAEKGE
jgi:hypothetical protein